MNQPDIGGTEKPVFSIFDNRVDFATIPDNE